jgi:cytidylate kinase
MENLFLKYMKERTGKRKAPEALNVSPGPVITISREYGCPALRIAQKLAVTLTAKNQSFGLDNEWRVISKEIIEESARELKLTPSLTKDLSDYKHNSFFENLALFFSDDYYPGDAKIKNTIAKFIHATAVEGNVIIVGRAGEAITKNIVKSFHAKLEAPIDWRAQVVSDNEGGSISDAKKKCQEQDRRRAQFRHYFEKNKPDIEFFDITFNCRELSDEEVVELLVIVAETRGFV